MVGEAGDRDETPYRALFEHSLDAVLIADDAGRFVDGNRAALALLGVPRDELLASGIRDVAVSPEQFDAVWPGFLETGQLEGEFQLRTGGGEVRTVEYRAVANLIPGYHLSVMRDVTARKQAEAQHRRLEHQLAISDRMVSVGTLAAGVAHEINNPLAVVVANLEMLHDDINALADEIDSPTRIASLRELVHDAKDGADRIRTIVRDLKLFSRPDEERREGIDVRKVLDSSARMAWNEIKHRAQLVREFGAVPPVWGNDARLGQVFLNLIVNAAQAIPEGNALRNQIRLATRTGPGGAAVIEICDTGKGIQPEHLPQLFEPFFTTKPIGIGTGLGLPICQRLVHELGGTIEVESVVDHGTTVRVTLPAAPARPTEPPPRRRTTIEATQRCRVLVVDDEPMIAATVERVLAQEHEVTAVRSAEDALGRISGGERYDLIISDLMMPQMTGMDLYDALAEVAPEQANAIVFLTGGAFTEHAASFLERVANPRLEKPFAPTALRAIAREHALRRR